MYLLAGVLAAACWGLATVLSKGVLEYVPPFTLLVAQVVASNLFLWGMIAWRRGLVLPPRRHFLRFGITGLLEPGLAYTFGVVGLSLTTASSAALLGAVETVFIILLAALILREQITVRLLGVGAIALGGAALVILSLNGGIDAGHTVTGDLLVLAGTFCAALYVVLSRRLVMDLDPLLLLALQQLFALAWAVAVWPIGALNGELAVLGEIGPLSWLFAGISGIVTYALAFWFYLVALRGVRASVASLFLALIPLFGVAGATLFLGETVSLLQVFGGILIVSSMLGVSRLQPEG